MTAFWLVIVLCFSEAGGQPCRPYYLPEPMDEYRCPRAAAAYKQLYDSPSALCLSDRPDGAQPLASPAPGWRG